MRRSSFVSLLKVNQSYSALRTFSFVSSVPESTSRMSVVPTQSIQIQMHPQHWGCGELPRGKEYTVSVVWWRSDFRWNRAHVWGDFRRNMGPDKYLQEAVGLQTALLSVLYVQTPLSDVGLGVLVMSGKCPLWRTTSWPKCGWCMIFSAKKICDAALGGERFSLCFQNVWASVSAKVSERVYQIDGAGLDESARERSDAHHAPCVAGSSVVGRREMPRVDYQISGP